jgi:hypothetical protein
VTITTGAALAPDDDAGDDDAESGIALAIAPDVAIDSPSVGPLLAATALTTTETPPTPPRVPLADRLRGAVPFTGPGLTGLGGIVLGCLIVGLGAAGDLALGDGLGVGFATTFLLGCVLVAATVRVRALGVAVVAPPLLFAGGYALETRTSGHTSGLREMALDVATSLALHAPLLFIGTAIAVAIALVRVAVHLIRR